MDNSYFLYTAKNDNVLIERFHICTWEFINNSSFVEFGCELNAKSLAGKNSVQMKLFVPWFTEGSVIEDFYNKLKVSENSRFIFNDSIIGSNSLDGGQNLYGIIHEFSERNKLCVLPVNLIGNNDLSIIEININLDLYNEFEGSDERANVYIRFCVTPKKNSIATRKKGITKSTILYDIKLNQRRNIPNNLLQEILQSELCNIKKCFCFNIIPNSYDLVFFDSSALQNVRTLEYKSFKNYLADDRIKDNELIVVFNKKDKSDNYAFFSIYSKEYIGSDQFALALLVNLLAGILLFIPSYQNELPFTFWLVVFIFFCMLLYFMKRWLNISFKGK